MDDKGKTLRCPECPAVLKGVWAEASYGRVIQLNQCPRCGGVWFDRWKLSFVKEGSLHALSRMDIDAFLAKIEGRNGEGKCPACSVALKDFRDPLLPKDAIVRLCALCHGLWLNRGSLRRYAEHRAALKGVKIKDLDEKEVAALRRLQKELDVRSIEEPKAAMGHPLDSQEVDTKEVLTDMAFVILQTLLRLVLKI